jgi:hypothetical protein
MEQEQFPLDYDYDPAMRLREKWLVKTGCRKPKVADRLEGVW